MINQHKLVKVVTEFSRRLTVDYAVSDALHDLTDTATELLGIAGAGISLARDDRLVFATAASDPVATLERVQEETQAGPCVDAHRGGEVVAVADLSAEERRWPALADAAATLGMGAVAGVPMHLNGARLGAMNLYDNQSRYWSDDELEAAQLLALMGAVYVAHAARIYQVRHTAEQLQQALDSRVVIEQAKGVLAGERKVSVDDAFQVLRRHARNNNASLRAVAEAVVYLGLRP